MSNSGIDALVEARIREAIARGELDDLPGTGKPLDLDDLTGLTPEQRAETLLMRTLGEVPEEVALLREIRATRARIDAASDDPAEQERLRALARDKAAQVSKLLDARRESLLEEKRAARKK